jgi:RimJ/RimL family protein N-acetyltransferase
MQLPELQMISKGGSPEGLNLKEGALPPDFITAMAIREIERGMETLWHSYFLFVEGNNAVGSGGFRGSPKEGRVEIGYGVAPSQQGKGFATAGAMLLVQKAFEQPGILEVFAETSITNIPSRRVVEKAGFQHIGQRNTEDDGLVDRWLLTRA